MSKKNRKERQIVDAANIEKCLILSPLHLSKKAVIWLNKKADIQADLEKASNLLTIHLAYCITQQTGWIIRINEDRKLTKEDLKADHIPKSLRNCVKLAQKKGCQLIEFHTDAFETSPELKTYAWPDEIEKNYPYPNPENLIAAIKNRD